MKAATPSTTAPFTIYADGKCNLKPDTKHLHELLKKNQLKELQITIDGNQLLGENSLSNLLGENLDYLPESASFTLVRFEPQENGTCFLIYKKNLHPNQ